MAGCYELASEVYAKGNYFSECLSACTKGKLFDTGLKYSQYWKEHAPKDNAVVKRSKEIDKIEQQFIESCANNCYVHDEICQSFELDGFKSQLLEVFEFP